MIAEAFFNSIVSHYQEKLPFVMYRLPNGKTIKGLLQHDDTLNYVKNFSETGFAFAPFDTAKDVVLIPLEDAELINTDYMSEKISINTDGAYKLNREGFSRFEI